MAFGALLCGLSRTQRYQLIQIPQSSFGQYSGVKISSGMRPVRPAYLHAWCLLASHSIAIDRARTASGGLQPSHKVWAVGCSLLLGEVSVGKNEWKEATNEAQLKSTRVGTCGAVCRRRSVSCACLCLCLCLCLTQETHNGSAFRLVTLEFAWIFWGDKEKVRGTFCRGLFMLETCWKQFLFLCSCSCSCSV